MSKFDPKRKTPCRECPFTKHSTRGWLGSDYPENFLDTTLRGADMPCHMEIDYSDKEWLTAQEPDAPMCAGALQFQNNHLSLSRDPKVAEAQRKVGTNPKVFETPEEFLIHHKVGKHSGPTETSFRWSATEVDRKRGLIPFATVECYALPVDEDEEGSETIYIARDDDGAILKVLPAADRTIHTKDWLAEWAGGRGKIAHHTVSREYLAALRKWVVA